LASDARAVPTLQPLRAAITPALTAAHGRGWTMCGSLWNKPA
jgi:hypothetical protein